MIIPFIRKLNHKFRKLYSEPFTISSCYDLSYLTLTNEINIRVIIKRRNYFQQIIFALKKSFNLFLEIFIRELNGFFCYLVSSSFYLRKLILRV